MLCANPVCLLQSSSSYPLRHGVDRSSWFGVLDLAAQYEEALTALHPPASTRMDTGSPLETIM